MSKPRVIPFKNPSGELVFRVVGVIDGKQRRKNYQTEAEAMTVKQNWERELLNLAPLPTITTRLSSEQAAEAEAVYLRLTGQPLTLVQCVDYALENFKPARTKKSVKDGFADFLAEKKRANLRDASVRTLRVRLNRWAKANGARMLDSITADCLRPAIFRDGSGLVNRESDYRAFTNFFNWAVTHGYCAASPMDKIPTIKLDPNEPVALDLAACRRLLGAATEYKHGRLLPYFVLALFCAIRPAELSRISWDDVDLENLHVRIGSKVAKMRGRRLVAISANAARFLYPHVVKKFPFTGRNFRKNFDEVKRLAGFATEHVQPGLAEWVPDVLRHTGISFHLAFHQHEGKTASWAGNSPDVIHRNYKGLVNAKDAAEFWNITPEEQDKKVLQLPSIERLKMATPA